MISNQNTNRLIIEYAYYNTIIKKINKKVQSYRQKRMFNPFLAIDYVLIALNFYFLNLDESYKSNS